MSKFQKQVSEFCLEGKILDVIVKDGYKLKYLRLATASGDEFEIKLSKQLRHSLTVVLIPGLKVQMVGEKKLNPKTGKLKLKAYGLKSVPNDPYGMNFPPEVTQEAVGVGYSSSASTVGVCPLPPPLSLPMQPVSVPREAASFSVESRQGIQYQTPETVSPPVINSAKILVCQKSDCRKRGSQEVCQVLAAVLKDRNLQDQVIIEETGCHKKCKAGPNLVMKPHNIRYSRVDSTDIPALIEEHFAED